MARKKLPENTTVRNLHIRIKGQENCILFDRFITDFKLSNVGKQANARSFINNVFSDLVMNFIKGKVLEDKEAVVYALIKPHIQRAIRESTKLSDVVMVKNMKELQEQNEALAKMLSYLLRAMTRITYKNESGAEAPVLTRNGVETGDAVGTALLPWIKKVFGGQE